MVNRWWLIIFFLILFPGISQGQDPGFSQFFANPIYLNPALTGTSELPRTVASYRNQWPGNWTTYQTYSISYDQNLKKQNFGLGFLLLHDIELNNVIKSTSASISYSYNLEFDNFNFVTLGLQAGLAFKQFNADHLIFPSEIDQLSGEIIGSAPLIFDTEKKLYPDFAVGLVGQQNDLFYGLSVHHLTQPNESITDGDLKGKLPAKFTAHIGARSRKMHYGLLTREFTISPNLLYQQQGSFKQLNVGIYMIEKSFQFGGWLRSNMDIRPDALIFLAGFAKEKFQFGYSFDFTLSKLSNYSYGSHEVSLTLFIPRKFTVPRNTKLLIPML